MCHWLSQLSDDNILKLIGIIGAAIAFFLALHQYTVSQKWKKAEFFVAEYKSFVTDPFVHKAMLLLDGYTMDFYVPKTDIDAVGEKVSFSPSALLAALTDIPDETQRDASQVYIRLCIDRFFFKMGIFNHYLKAGFVSREETENFLSYWIDLIGNKQDESILKNDARLLLHKFLKKFNYKETIELIQSFKGYVIN